MITLLWILGIAVYLTIGAYVVGRFKANKWTGDGIEWFMVALWPAGTVVMLLAPIARFAEDADERAERRRERRAEKKALREAAHAKAEAEKNLPDAKVIRIRGEKP